MRSATFETGLTLGSTDNTFLDLDNSGYHENLIQYNSLLLPGLPEFQIFNLGRIKAETHRRRFDNAARFFDSH